MAKESLSGKLVVILHADVADSTALVRQNEQLAHERIQTTFHSFGDTISKYHGRVRELRGDALLAEFERASDAVTAALAFQSEQHDYLAQITDKIQPELRVGIALGEVIIADDTITGAGVVLAQRLEQMAERGGVVIQGAIYETIPERFPFEYENLGEHRVKGFDESIRAYKVTTGKGNIIPPPQETWRHEASGKSRIKIASFAAIAVAVALVALFWIKPWETDVVPASVERMALPLPEKPSIAVLPFTNMSNDAEQEYFADGMTEDLITDISRISGLDVIARHSTFSYKGQSPDVREVGRDLDVSHVIEGSVRKVGNTVRITIQLINAADGKHVWAERYDRDLRDVFAIQDEVIGKIIMALSLKLTPEEEKRVVKRGTENLAAYDLYMRGRQQESFFNKEAFVEAQQLYEQAVMLDPNYAVVWAHLAQIHTLNGQFGWVDDIVTADQRALELVEKSVALDPDIPFSHFSYSRILARESIGQHDRAIVEARKAIGLDPNYADAHAYLGQLFILTGQAEKTIIPITTAMRINPNFPFWYYYTYGFAHFFMGDFETAVENIEKAVERNPTVFFLRTTYAASLAMAGRQDDAEWEIDELHGLGFNKTLEEFMSETPVQDPAYRALYREGLVKAGLL